MKYFLIIAAVITLITGCEKSGNENLIREIKILNQQYSSTGNLLRIRIQGSIPFSSVRWVLKSTCDRYDNEFDQIILNHGIDPNVITEKREEIRELCLEEAKEYFNEHINWMGPIISLQAMVCDSVFHGFEIYREAMLDLAKQL